MTSATRQSICDVVEASLLGVKQNTILPAEGMAAIMAVIDSMSAEDTNEQNREIYRREYEAAIVKPEIPTP